MNIWENYNFTIEPDKVLTFLKAQEQNMYDKTQGILIQQTETCYSSNESRFTVYATSPNLGNYRRKILQIVYNDLGYQLIGYNGNSVGEQTHNADEMIKTISDYTQQGDIGSIIVNLYQMSYDNTKNKI